MLTQSLRTTILPAPKLADVTLSKLRWNDPINDMAPARPMPGQSRVKFASNGLLLAAELNAKTGGW